MNKFVRLSVIAGLLMAGAGLVNTSFAANEGTPVTLAQLPDLTQDPQDATVSERVTARFTRSHSTLMQISQRKSSTVTSTCSIMAITY